MTSHPTPSKASFIPEVLSPKLASSGIFGAVLFFAFSLLPTMVPRSVLVQAAGSGLAITVGYGLGVFLRWLVSYLEISIPSRSIQKHGRIALLAILCLILVADVWQFVYWQNELRQMFGIEMINPFFLLPVIIVSIILFALLLCVGRIVRWLYRMFVRYLDKHLPRRVSIVLGAGIAVGLLFFLINGVIIKGVFAAANSSLAISNGIIDESLSKPKLSELSGSPQSYVPWESLGRNGRMFIASSPSAADIKQVTGVDAKQPIRAYVGLDSDTTMEKRADLLLRELIRSGAFERKSLLVTTSVGDGWLDAQAIEPFEYVNDGNTAVAGIQYSYLPSALSLFADADAVKSTSQHVFQVIYQYWLTLPEDARPELYLYGLSLGSYGVEAVLNSAEFINTPVRGALLAGPPFINQFHRELETSRDPGSPLWRPVINNGTTVRFTGKDSALDKPQGVWGNTRIAYLQHASDPITWFRGDLFYKKPLWLQDGERGPDISENFVWVPIVTAYQIGLDMILSFNYPPGYAHNYAASTHVDAWASLTRPADWSDTKANTLKAYFDKKF